MSGWAAFAEIAGKAGDMLFGNYSQRTSAKYARLMQERDHAFQERMSNTRHQRETKDLEAAGLNRILGISQGATSPSGGGGGGPGLASPGGQIDWSAKRAMWAATKLTNEQANTEKARGDLIRNQSNAMEGVSGFGESVGEVWF